MGLIILLCDCGVIPGNEALGHILEKVSWSTGILGDRLDSLVHSISHLVPKRRGIGKGHFLGNYFPKKKAFSRIYLLGRNIRV